MNQTRSIYIVNGVTAFLFSCTGPVAIVITVASTHGLSDQHIASWLFGGFAVAGLYTLYYSIRYRQPLSFAWTIPGTVLLLSALDHLNFSEIVGAYMVTAVLIIVVGLSGWIKSIMEWIPKPLVMAMVAGIFLDFGLNLIAAFESSVWVASTMVIAFVAVSLSSNLQKYIPPILAALIMGAIVVVMADTIKDTGPLPGLITTPLLFAPQFSLQAILELVIPLAITVLVVQNGQGFAVLTNAGHKPPMNSMTTACGTGSIILGLIGSVSMCVTGPSNAILSSSGRLEGQYLGGIVYGILGIIFGVLATLMTWLALKLPEAYIAVLGGLAVFKVLQSSMVAAFSERYSLGALVTFIITVSDVNIFNIGAPFWGLVFGAIISGLLERNE